MERAERRWWTMDAAETLAELESGPHGIDEAEAERRFTLAGPNVISEPEGISPLALLLRQFRSPLIYILLAAALLTLAMRELTDTAIITVALGLNAVVGFLQEYRAERALLALRQMTVPTAAVLRRGRDREVDSRGVVPGDILLLQTGNKVAADARLVHAVGLQVDESLLTGESTVVEKTTSALQDPELPVADRLNMVYMGTVVTAGRAHAVVTSTGMSSQLGRIAGEMQRAEVPTSPLQLRMARFSRLLGAAILVVCGIAFPLGIAAGEPASAMLRTVVALIVAAIPEGLPVVLTVTLAIGVNRMARRNAIVRTLPAVETLGSCTVIASDKTGTLTENRMTVQAVYVGGRTYRATGRGDDLDGGFEADGQRFVPVRGSPLWWTLLAGVLNNEASLHLMDGKLDVAGDPTEVALLVAGAKAGIFKGDAEEEFDATGAIPFESELRYSATYHIHEEHGSVLFVKGAPERVLAMCRDVADRDRPTALIEHEVMAAVASLGREGLRVLAFAYRASPEESLVDVTAEPRDLTLLGLVGMMDPPRPEAAAAVAACEAAGIRVLMLTGDHASTASAIASRIGIDAGGETIEGRQIEAASDEDLDEIVSRARIYARVAPAHKLRIVEALRRRGEVVAVTGDGVNDAPALRAADIGVAMGMRGTDVAKEASDLVVTDDNFATIVSAVEEGRVVFDNVRKVTFFLLSTGIAVVIAVFVTLIGGFPLPLLPAQIIWVNLVTNGVQGIALAFEPGEPDVLKKRPRPIGEGIVSRVLWERTALVGLTIAAATLAFFLSERYLLDASLERARTMALTTMVLFQAVHVGNARSEHLSAFRKSPFSNRFLFLGTVVALAVHIGALYWGPTQALLEVEPLKLAEWLRIAPAALCVVLVVELHKIVRRPRDGAR